MSAPRIIIFYAEKPLQIAQQHSLERKLTRNVLRPSTWSISFLSNVRTYVHFDGRCRRMDEQIGRWKRRPLQIAGQSLYVHGHIRNLCSKLRTDSNSRHQIRIYMRFFVPSQVFTIIFGNFVFMKKTATAQNDRKYYARVADTHVLLVVTNTGRFKRVLFFVNVEFRSEHVL